MTDGSNALINVHAFHSAFTHTQTESVCAYKDSSRRGFMKYTDTLMDKERWPQIWKVFTYLVPCYTSWGSAENKHACGFWLPFGDQNECCIGSMRKTWKAVEAMLDSMTPASNALPRRQAGRLKTKYNINNSLTYWNYGETFYPLSFNHE